MLSPAVSKTFFQWFTSAMPFLTSVLIVLQTQLQDHEIDPWKLGSVAIGAFLSLVVAQANSARGATERAENTAEVATGRDQDNDQLVENPE